MDSIVEYLFTHGYWIIVAGLFIDATGLPFPGEALLLGTGFLVVRGSLDLEIVIPVAIVTVLLGDSLSFTFGRYLSRSRGKNLVSVYCRWTSSTLSSNACHDRAQRFLDRHQGRTIVIGKFLWGAREFIPPLAGMSRIPYLRFLMLDALGTGLWVATFVSLGIVFEDELQSFVSKFESVTSFAAWLLAGALALVLVLKVLKRKRFGPFRQQEEVLLVRQSLRRETAALENQQETTRP